MATRLPCSAKRRLHRIGTGPKRTPHGPICRVLPDLPWKRLHPGARPWWEARYVVVNTMYTTGNTEEPSAAGAVVLVPFAFSDMSRSKRRPPVVLADAGRSDWVLCQITSEPYVDPRAIPLGSPDFQASSLQALFLVSDPIFPP
jgi:hypothetical protein